MAATASPFSMPTYMRLPSPEGFSTLKGGRASNTIVLPTSFSVNQTCLPSGVAAMSGQNGPTPGNLSPRYKGQHQPQPLVITNRLHMNARGFRQAADGDAGIGFLRHRESLRP